MRKILIATDSWRPELNGVVTTLENLVKEGIRRNIQVFILSPNLFFSVKCPFYGDIRLSVFIRDKIKNIIKYEDFNAIHLTDEGPICFNVRNYCIKNNIPFTTAFHTNIPEYANSKLGLPASWFYKISYLFHRKASATFVPTATTSNILEKYGFRNIIQWTRGVDLNIFKSYDIELPYEKPIHLFVGRISPEKNLEAFLDLKLSGSKVLVGPGPLLNYFTKKYPDAHFLGRKIGKELVDLYTGADVFVFPSKKDVFGLSQIEALACGTPVAAFPAPGPLDILNDKVGTIDNDLEYAIERSLTLSSEDCIEFSKKFTWSKCADIFFGNLRWINVCSDK